MTEKKESRVAKIPTLPNLHESKVSSMEMCPSYWTPKEEGEFKVGVIIDMIDAKYEDEKTGDAIILPCIVMLAQNEDGTFGAVKNGSKRLVASIEDLISSGTIMFDETPIKITYTGKVNNKKNSFQSDTWSIRKINIE